MKHLYILFFIFLIFSGCSVKYENRQLFNEKNFDENIKKLSFLVQSISKNINKEEANNFSYEVINYSKVLANKYKIIKPALFHNSLINMGFKQKGYCYDFTNDLKKYLNSKKYKSFKFIKAVANRGEYFEHNSLVLTREDTSFKNSIILDAWRNSGILYFSKVKDDKNYNWEVK